jgi:hypothetical protein
MTACGDNTFCCNGEQSQGTCNCTTKNGTIPVEPGRVQTVIGLSGAVSTQTPAWSASPTSAASPSSKTSATNSTTASSTAVPKKSVTQTTAFKAGVGAGAALLGIFIIVILVLVCCGKSRGPHGSPVVSAQTNYSSAAYLTPAGGPTVNRTGPTEGMSHNPVVRSAVSDPYRERTASPTNPFDDGTASRSITPTPTNMLGGSNRGNRNDRYFTGPSQYPSPPLSRVDSI